LLSVFCLYFVNLLLYHVTTNVDMTVFCCISLILGDTRIFIFTPTPSQLDANNFDLRQQF
ncbi:hypothetical protein, partial [Staphylococcus pseudintermedius]|uniref:hypothetical protein n=1 Tax=Staphylococcus pseudintermedius TaxID=283734 RepID=UPI000D3F5631